MTNQENVSTMEGFPYYVYFLIKYPPYIGITVLRHQSFK